MLAISSGYKNDLVCTQHAVSLTSFNFSAVEEVYLAKCKIYGHNITFVLIIDLHTFLHACVCACVVWYLVM